MTGTSKYIDGLLSVSKVCSAISRRDRYHSAAQLFFQTISKQMGARTQTNPGDRTFFSKSFENAIIAGFKTLPDIKAEANPTIEWDKRKAKGFPRKQLDIIAYNENTADKAFVFEIKSRHFNPMAAAIMEFAVALRYGLKIKSANFGIPPNQCCFTVLLADCTCLDEAYFNMLFPLIGVDGFAPELHCIFRNDLVRERKTDIIFNTVYRLYRECGIYLTS